MAKTKGNEKLKGIYLVPDPLMMKPHFGPSEHIKVGLDELKKEFEIDLMLGGEINQDAFTVTRQKSATRSKAVNNGFIGMLRDLKLLMKSNISVFKLYRKIKKEKVDFIYERGQYLDFRGVIIAKVLGIKHFYEVNWLNFLGIRQFYTSWFNGIAKYLEELSYAWASINFFVGTQDRLIKIHPSKVCTIQNGIGEELITANRDLVNKVDATIKICYVANLMPHHRFDVFLKCLPYLKHVEQLELHLIGYNFEEHITSFPPHLKYIIHGPVKKEFLPELLSEFNIGLISGGPSYSSFMKLFEYAAFKLCVICPDLENITLMFDPGEILFFKDEEERSLAEQLNLVCSNPSLVPEYGNKIFTKVQDEYTWEAIYKKISMEMKKFLN